ncbi:MAG: Hsp20 family protein [Christensenellales bacterium]
MANLIPVHRGRLTPTGFEDFYNVLDDFFSDPWTSGHRREAFKLDVEQTDEEYLIEAELPGAKKDEISIELTEGTLQISYNREETKDEENKNYIHRERRSVSSRRSIYLGDANAQGIRAKLDGGILKITVPRQQRKDNSRIIDIE